MTASFAVLLVFVATISIFHEADSRWSSWTSCSASCGKGISIRYRRCNPRFDECSGITREIKHCIERFCPSYLSWPRIHFGGTLITDTSTLNNDACNYDTATFDGSSVSGWNPDGSGHAYLSSGNITTVCTKPRHCDPYHEITIAKIIQVSTAVLVDVDPDWMISTELWGLKLRIEDHFSGEMLPVSTRKYGSRSPHGQRDESLVAVYKSKLKIETWESDATRKMFKNAEFLSISLVLDYFNFKTSSCRLIGTIGMTSDDDSLQTMVTRKMRGLHSHKPVVNAPFYIHRQPKVLTIDLAASTLADKNMKLRSIERADLAMWLPRAVFCKLFWTFKDCMLGKLLADLVIYPITHGGWISRYLDKYAKWYFTNAGVIDIDLSYVPTEIFDLMAQHRLGIVRNLHSGSREVIWGEDALGIQVEQMEKIVHKLSPGEERRVTVVVSAFGKPATNVHVEMDSFVKNVDEKCRAKCDRTLGKPRDALLISRTTSSTDFYGKVTFTVKARHGPGKSRGCSLIGQLYPLRIIVRYSDGSKTFLYEQGSKAKDLYDSNIHLNSFNAVIQIFDDEPNIACPTWLDIKHIFHQYYNLYPVMWKNGIIDVHSYDDVKRKARSLKAAMFDFEITDARYMPTQRDMSVGRRRLIWNWMKCGMKYSNETDQGQNLDICADFDARLESLKRDIEDAAFVEFATLPPYFTAWLSIKSEEGRNLAVSNIIKSVMEDEMRHLAMAMNLVNAIAGKVTFFKSRPWYPLTLSRGKLYGLLKGKSVPLAKISKGLLSDVFSRIEQPLSDGGKQLVETIATVWLTHHSGRPKNDNETLYPTMRNLLKDFNSLSKKEHLYLERGIPHIGSWRKIYDFASNKLDQLQDIHTVGGFYTKIALQIAALEACAKLGKSKHSTIFVGSRHYQLNSSHWYNSREKNVECAVQDVAKSMGAFKPSTKSPRMEDTRRTRLKSTHQAKSCSKQDSTDIKTIVPVWDFRTALQAIVEIVFEGEGGSACTPFVELNETNSKQLAHYYRFQEIAHGRRLAKVQSNQIDPSHTCLNLSTWCQESLEGWSFCYSGEKLHLFDDGVWDILTNPGPHTYTPGTNSYNLNARFNSVYGLLMTCLGSSAFGGHPDSIKNCMAYMHDMTVIGKRMVSTVIDQDSSMSSKYYTIDKNIAPSYI